MRRNRLLFSDPPRVILGFEDASGSIKRGKRVDYATLCIFILISLAVAASTATVTWSIYNHNFSPTGRRNLRRRLPELKKYHYLHERLKAMDIKKL